VFNRLTADRQGRRRPAIPRVLMLPLANLDVGRERRASADGVVLARSRRPGRPKALDPYQAGLARKMHASGEKVAAIAAALRVSPSNHQAGTGRVLTLGFPALKSLVLLNSGTTNAEGTLMNHVVSGVRCG